MSNTKKKKLLFVIESLVIGGAERVLIDYVNNLDSQKFDITVCSVFKYSVYDNYNYEFDSPFRSHIHFKSLINNKNNFLYRCFNALLVRIPQVLFRLLIGKNYDKYIAFYEGLPTKWIAESSIPPVKKIAWLHTSTKLSQHGKGPKSLEIQEKQYLSFGNIIAVSKDVKKIFLNTFRQISPNRVSVAHNPVNIQSIRDKALQPKLIQKPLGTKLFVSVGRITPAKGYERYINILANLATESLEPTVWVIGGGDTCALEQLCSDKKLHNIHLLGNQTNPYPYMACADWIIIPSIIEGFSTVALEALALGKAVIATDCPGMKEIFGNSEFGLVSGNNSEDLTLALKRACINDELQKHYQVKSSQRAESFSVAESIAKISPLL